MPEDVFTLPGITTPLAPNWESRIELPYGSVLSVPLMGVDDSDTIPRMDVFISQQIGTGLELVFESHNNAYIFQRVDGGVRFATLRVTNKDFNVTPGTYFLRIFVNGSRYLERHLHVLNETGAPIRIAASMPTTDTSGSQSGATIGEFVIAMDITANDPIVEWDTETNSFRTTNTPGGLDLDGGLF